MFIKEWTLCKKKKILRDRSFFLLKLSKIKKEVFAEIERSIENSGQSFNSKTYDLCLKNVKMFQFLCKNLPYDLLNSENICAH